MGFADQALSSAQNFLLLVLVARTASSTAFGAFAVAFGIYTLALSGAQAVFSEPLLITQSATPAASETHRAALSRAITGSALLGTVLGIGTVPTALAIGGPTRAPLLALAATAIPLLVHDGLRFAALAQGRPSLALALDGSWVAIWAGGAWANSVIGQQATTTEWLVWAVPTVVTSAAGWILLGIRPAGLREISQSLKETRALVGPLLLDFAVATGLAQVISLVMAATLGLRSIGGFRAAQALLGPANTLASASRIVFVPEFVRVDVRSPRGRHALRGVTVVVVGAICVYSVLAVALPGSVGRALFGDTWATARSLVLPVAAARVFGAMFISPAAGLRAMRATRSAARAQIIGSGATLLFVAPGLVGRNVGWCAWGIALGCLAIAVAHWQAFRARVASDRSQSPPAEDRIEPLEDAVRPQTAPPTNHP